MIFNNIGNQDKESDANNQEQNTNDDETLVEKDFELFEAKKIMDKYLMSDLAGTYYIQSLHKQSDNNYLAIKKVKTVKQISCQKIREEASVEEDSDLGVILSNCWSNGGNDGKLYNYDDVLKSKKELFGSKSSLEKLILYII